MRHRTKGFVLGIALTLAVTGSLWAQSENGQRPETADLAAAPSPTMADFLRSEAAKTHCCTTERLLEGAMLYKWAAEHGFDGNPENLDAAIADLRLAAYFFYYAGELDRALSALVRAGVIERDRGRSSEAAVALWEAAHIARGSGDLESAREILFASMELEPDPVTIAERP